MSNKRLLVNDLLLNPPEGGLLLLKRLEDEYITRSDLQKLVDELKLGDYTLKNALVVLTLKVKLEAFAVRIDQIKGLSRLIQLELKSKHRRFHTTNLSKAEADYSKLCRDLNLVNPLKDFNELQSCLHNSSNLYSFKEIVRILSLKVSDDFKVYSSETFEVLQSTFEHIATGELQASSPGLKLLWDRQYLLIKAKNVVNSEVGYNPFEPSKFTLNNNVDDANPELFKQIDDDEDLARDILILATAKGEDPELIKRLNQDEFLTEVYQASLANQYQVTSSKIKALCNDLKVLRLLNQDYKKSFSWIRETAVTEVRNLIEARCTTNSNCLNQNKLTKFIMIFDERTCRSYLSEKTQKLEDLARILGVTKGRVSQLDNEFKVLLEEALSKAHKQETAKCYLIKSLQENLNFNRQKQLMLLDVLISSASERELSLRWGITLSKVKSIKQTVDRLLEQQHKSLYSFAS